MRKPNTRKITVKEKATILAERRLGLETIKQTAAKHEVSEVTVYKIIKTDNEDVLKMADAIERSLTERIKETRDLALNVIHDKLQAGNVPLNHATTAFGVLYDKHALETGRPTSITQHNYSPERNALEFFRVLLVKEGTFDKALAAFRQASLAPLVSDFTRDTVADQVAANPKLLDE